MYEITARKFILSEDQMTALFILVLDESDRILFIQKAKPRMSYANIRKILLSKYRSDTRQIQVEGHLQQLHVRNIMHEDDNTDVRKGLTVVVNNIEDLIPQCYPEFQTDRHKINYLTDAVAEFSDWLLGPIENIHSHKYTFNRFVTALHESIQTKLKVNMIKRERSGNVDNGRRQHQLWSLSIPGTRATSTAGTLELVTISAERLEDLRHGTSMMRERRNCVLNVAISGSEAMSASPVPCA